MDDLLDRFFETMEYSLKGKFPMYIVKVSQVKGSFYVLIRIPRGNILNNNLTSMIDDAKFISEEIYKDYSEKSNRFRYNFFSYFKLVKCYVNYQYHFFVVRKD